MKRIFLAAILTIGFLTGSAQLPPGVTKLQYLQSVVTNKAQFIGQPFSNLKNTLLLPVLYFSRTLGTNFLSKETSTSVSSYAPISSEDFYLIYPYLEIVWQSPLDAVESNNIWTATGGNWSPAATTFYASAIIADIKLVQ